MTGDCKFYVYTSKCLIQKKIKNKNNKTLIGQLSFHLRSQKIQDLGSAKISTTKEDPIILKKP